MLVSIKADVAHSSFSARSSSSQKAFCQGGQGFKSEQWCQRGTTLTADANFSPCTTTSKISGKCVRTAFVQGSGPRAGQRKGGSSGGATDPIPEECGRRKHSSPPFFTHLGHRYGRKNFAGSLTLPEMPPQPSWSRTDSVLKTTTRPSRGSSSRRRDS